MPCVQFQGKAYPLKDGESVLDALLRGGAPVAYSCKNGVCQSCAMRALDGEVPADTQGELKPTLRAQGYFLACQWRPRRDVEVAPVDEASLFSHASVLDVHALAPDICRVRLDSALPLYYHAGQFVNLRRADGLTRSYSLASMPCHEAFLELHVKRMENGRMSNWIHDELRIGDKVDIQGPYGQCFYLSGREEQPLLMVGTGTGAAPLWGIMHDALNAGHRGPVYFYHGARRAEGLYLHKELLDLGRVHAHFHYVPCVSGGEPPPDGRAGRADQQALADFPDMRGMRLFLCGMPEMVKKTRKLAYLAGATMNDIYVDPFEMTELRAESRV